MTCSHLHSPATRSKRHVRWRLQQTPRFRQDCGGSPYALFLMTSKLLSGLFYGTCSLPHIVATHRSNTLYPSIQCVRSYASFNEGQVDSITANVWIGLMCDAQELDLLTTQAFVAEQTLKDRLISSGCHASLERSTLPSGSGIPPRPADVLAMLSAIDTDTWQVRLALAVSDMQKAW